VLFITPEQVIAITRCVSWALMPQKCVSGQGSAPDPAGGTCSAPQNPSWIWGGCFACLI